MVELLNENAVIVYDGLPYPGIVIDVDSQDVQIKCMHRIGKNWGFFVPEKKIYAGTGMKISLPKFPHQLY